MSETVVAVALIVDSSLTLSLQWGAILQHYINPLIQRLFVGKDGAKFNIGLVTYGMSDMHPSPILAKRYFVHPTHIYKELREDSQKLGLGRTSAGGKLGMAALEGYAATIEMFDLFIRSLQDDLGDKPITDAEAQFHIIHVLSSAPDESRHPLWNQSSELDTLSWKTMPDELKKRDINLNVIFLRQNIVLSDLHSQMVSEPCQPWFMVHPGHNILLSSTSSWSPSPAAKRPPEEVPPEASEEAKKPRVASPVKAQPSPKPPTPQPPAQPAATSTAGPSTAETTVKQPAPAPAPGAPNVAGGPAIVQIVTRAKLIEIEIKRLYEEMKVAMDGQRHQDVENIKKKLNGKRLDYEKLKQLAMQLSAAHLAGASRPNPMGGPSAGGLSGPKPGEASGSGGQGTFVQSDANRDASQNAPAGPLAGMTANQPTQVPTQQPAVNAGVPAPAVSLQDRQAIAQIMQNRFSQPLEKPPILAQNGGTMPNLPPNIPPSVALQYQKLMEQRGVVNGQQPLLPAAPMPQTTFPNQQPSLSTWSGRMEWSGSDQITRARKEVSAEVIVHGQGNGNIRPDLWPPVLTLSPSKEQAVPVIDLKNWVVQHKAQVCTITAKIDVPNPVINDANFKSLVALLVEKRVYAIASWNLPGRGGVKGEALLMFPGQRGELAGACFPETGIPVYPKPSMVMNPQMPGNMGGGMVPNPVMNQTLNPNFNHQQLLAMRLAQLKAQNGGTLPLNIMNMINRNNGNNNNAMGANNNNMGGAWNMDPGMNQLGGPSNGMNFGGGSNVQPLQPGFQMQGGMQPNLNPNANLMQQMQQQMQQQNQFHPGAGNPGNFNSDMFQHLMKR
ncbi:hypothetical protein SCHPADRAFT_993633 [Schizopora paradoxa]|uniref:Uncharacterized protein n=1 Tax=Schizopora paradoxa TaxID=27342 RepID=A0A0H2S3A2_9AGAM|nr:hypothetical protein SCHPADRAFT_993633 [Schizopora paradoxa]